MLRPRPCFRNVPQKIRKISNMFVLQPLILAPSYATVNNRQVFLKISIVAHPVQTSSHL
jgi:hypothetical protein